MTIPEILGDEERRRQEFPVCARQVFLAHAGVCPLPQRVAHAMTAYIARSTQGDQEAVLDPGFEKDTRALAARLIGAAPEEIAFVGPTSLALSYVAGGLPWRRGDNILICHEDYPANVYPWMALAERGVQVRYLNTREPGRVRLIDVQGQVDESTRLVALGSTHFVSGWRLDVPALGRWLHQRNILFCLDAIQALGAFPLAAEHVDFLAADAHKWLLGPCGTGLLYVKRDLQARLRPIAYGWNNVRCPNYLSQPDLVLRPDARRYEVGTHGLVGLHGLRAALELLLEVGVEAIAAELIRKRDWLVPALQSRGWTVLHADAPLENRGSILSLRREDVDLPARHQALLADGIVTSLRSLPDGQRVLRLSPHFYNTDAELQQLVERL